MIISSSQVNAVLKARNLEQTMNTPDAKECSSTTDRSESFDERQMVNKVKRAVLQETDIRPDKVAIIKYKIAKGNYPISGSEVADKMINRILVDSILADDDT
ncbi:MAG TPA: flagellar biosynthesis anti-sigma factor FlgM [Bacillota bacterium]|nr:flagellar biosynthesis anti-sigma factor FlgM [Bacillota bacterium]HPT87142.1 flagellar biosynthesis anti-sigma factor FlgM [Bacillota bacterium]